MDFSLPGSSVHGILMPFSRGSFWPRDGTQISHIAGGFFTVWTTREAPVISLLKVNSFTKNSRHNSCFVIEVLKTIEKYHVSPAISLSKDKHL